MKNTRKRTRSVLIFLATALVAVTLLFAKKRDYRVIKEEGIKITRFEILEETNTTVYFPGRLEWGLVQLERNVPFPIRIPRRGLDGSELAAHIRQFSLAAELTNVIKHISPASRFRTSVEPSDSLVLVEWSMEDRLIPLGANRLLRLCLVDDQQGGGFEREALELCWNIEKKYGLAVFRWPSDQIIGTNSRKFRFLAPGGSADIELDSN